jgi:hypothetical protein
MILLGDIACPNIEHAEFLKAVFQSNSLFHDKDIVCNLEGLVSDDYKNVEQEPVLYNHTSAIGVLAKAGVKVVSLANNHTLDLPRQFEKSTDVLSQNGIKHAGAGRTMAEAGMPTTFNDHGQEVMMMTACWDFLLYHQTNPSGDVYVNTYKEHELIEDIKKYKSSNSIGSKLLIYLHWSFDLETIPFPLYRTWSEAMIDAGADFVVGCHSHCVQGGEKYKNGYIVYGLGNFYLPNNYFANGKLYFPDFSRLQLAFEYNFIERQAMCHWFLYNDDNTLKHLSSENFEDSVTLRKYSPFQKMVPSEYVTYYKNNRRKSKLIPVYVDYRKVRSNSIFTKFLKLRARIARYLAKKKVINWQN